MFDDIRLRPLCANGLSGHPPVRTLVQAMADLGWPLEKRLRYLRELYGEPPQHVDPWRRNASSDRRE